MRNRKLRRWRNAREVEARFAANKALAAAWKPFFDAWAEGQRQVEAILAAWVRSWLEAINELAHALAEGPPPVDWSLDHVHTFDEWGQCEQEGCGFLFDGGDGLLIEDLLDESTLEWMTKTGRR